MSKDEAAEARGKPGQTRTYTLAGLLGLFVLAALVILASRLVPGGLGRTAKRAINAARARAGGRAPRP